MSTTFVSTPFFNATTTSTKLSTQSSSMSTTSTSITTTTYKTSETSTSTFLPNNTSITTPVITIPSNTLVSLFQYMKK